MKLTILIAACLAIAAVQAVEAASIQNDLPIADKSMMEKQRFMLQILLRVSHPLAIEEWIKLGSELNNDQANYKVYNLWMTRFYQTYRSGGLLPQREFFSINQKNHALQAIGLFHFFYNTKDYDTFVHNVAWARLNVNPGMFVYALTLAALHREDMKDIILPQIYEIFPQMFLSSKYIVQAEGFDWDVFNRQIMLEKELISTYKQDPAAGMFGKSFYSRDWKVWQWWKLMGLDDGWHVEGKSMLRENIQVMQNDPMWASIYSNLKMVWMPVDYTRDIEIMNDDSVLSYFTEDVGLNAYWYYLNMDYSTVLPAKEFNLDKDRRAEWWMYNVQQILARYNMERLSHGLGEIPELSWHEKVATGYNPQLISYSGQSYTVRKNYWQIESYQNRDLLNKIMNIQRRIEDIVSSGRFVMRNGTVLDLSQIESIEIIGNLLHGNIDVLDHNLLGYWWYFSNMFLSGAQYHDSSIPPNTVMAYETMLRDPLSFSLLMIPARIRNQFLYQQPPYTKEELLIPELEITDVKVSKLMTYFDFVDLDITTLLNDKMVMPDGKLVWDKTLLARQMRLNHEPFQIEIELWTKKPRKVVVRTFMAPDFDQYGQKINLFTNRENFMEIDSFIIDLAAGRNELIRNSKVFATTAGDPVTYSELYNYLMNSYDGVHQFQLNISNPHSLFPDRLILPHGSAEGLPMALFFMISPLAADYEPPGTYDRSWQSGIGSGVRHFNNMPFGYPLDRKIDDLYEFLVPNMFLKHVKIYHMEKLDKYFPKKSSNYGSFDYNY